MSDNSLRNEILTWVDHLSEIRAFKVHGHLKIEFSNIDPPPPLELSWSVFFCSFLFFQLLSWFSFSELWLVFSIWSYKKNLESVILVQRKLALNIHVKFLFFFCSVCEGANWKELWYFLEIDKSIQTYNLIVTCSWSQTNDPAHEIMVLMT